MCYLKQERQHVQAVRLVDRVLKRVVLWIVMYHVHLMDIILLLQTCLNIDASLNMSHLSDFVVFLSVLFYPFCLIWNF